ncbi:MAG: LytR C-terminal domain-containing protein [Candidatus Krumholzibacteriota bacterium]
MRGRLNSWLLLLVAVCAVSLWLGKDLVPDGNGDQGQDDTPTVAAASYSMSPREAPIHLSVLNGTGKAGLARRFSLLLGRTGCVAESVGNAPHRRFDQSLLVNRKLSDDKAAGLARLLGGIRVIREWDGRGSEDAVLVLGGDFAALEAALDGRRASGDR